MYGCTMMNLTDIATARRSIDAFASRLSPDEREELALHLVAADVAVRALLRESRALRGDFGVSDLLRPRLRVAA
jgi:hypothetical protein